MIDGIKSWFALADIPDYDYNGLRFTPKQSEGYNIYGSLHKFYNNGLHNADDYTYIKFIETLNHLYYDIKLNPDITTLNGFEFGVNVILPYNPDLFISKVITFKYLQGITKKFYKEFSFDNYTIKLYNKSKLSKPEEFKNENILRIEFKAIKMKILKPFGINCKVLSDLTDIKLWENFESILLKIIDDCLIIDLTDSETISLSHKEKIKYLNYINPLYWTKIHPNNRMYHYHKNCCKSFISEHSNSTLKTDLKNLIKQKCIELRTIPESEKIVFHWKRNNGLKMQNCNKLPIKINEYNITIPDQSDNVVLCAGCGKPILNPKKNQKFCSAKIVGESTAHKCRNMDSNPRNNTKKSIRKILSIPLMFELSETIAPNKRMYLY